MSRPPLPMKPAASIILLTYNNLDYTRQCLESIYAHTRQPAFEVIVVDNASQDSTPAYLKAFAEGRDNFKLILNQHNSGFAAGNNTGAAAAQGEYLVFLNNDTVVTPGWLPGLLAHLQDPSVGMVGPVTNSSANETRIAVDYQDLDEMEAFAARHTAAHPGQAFEIAMLPLLCAALRREVFEQVGPLDEAFGTGMFEDDDYALRLKQAGFRLLCAEDVFIHHWGSASFSRLGFSDYWKLFRHNMRLFEEKWGIQWTPHALRPDLLQVQMRQMIDDALWRAEQVEEREREIERLHQQVGELRAYLEDLYRSKAWRLIRFLWGIRLALFPAGSRRARLLRGLVSPVRSLFRLFDGPAPTGKMMSWGAYVFERYKRARHTIFPPSLDGVSVPSENGLVSIVLPVYNGARYLREALDSILSQTYTHFELIVVDDGSTDETPTILDDVARHEPRMQVVHQPNQRLPGALNTGFCRAKGEFLTWTSVDNRLKPNFLEKMVDCLQRHPAWDMVYANVDIIDERGQPLRGSRWYDASQSPPGSEHIALPVDPAEINVLPDNYIGAAFLYRSRAAHLVGPYSRYRFGTEDYDYWMRMNALLNLRHADFPEQVYEYRFHSTSLTSRDKELKITANRDALMVLEDGRRDFYLSPLAWMFFASEQADAQALAARLKDWAVNARHIVYPEPPADDSSLGEIWLPFVWVQVASSARTAQFRPAGPARAYQVLVITGDEPLPTDTHPRWDLCIAAGGQKDLPRLPGNQQGWVSAPDIPSLAALVDIGVKGAQLQALEEQIFEPPTPGCKISVVICTYLRGEQLRQALVSAARQTLPGEDYEVIVVNNQPSDHTPGQIVAELQKTEYEPDGRILRLVECPLKGLSFARNTGIAVARGALVSFLDDDATALPNWLEQVWAAYEQHPQAGVIGGPVVLAPPTPRPRWLKPGWQNYWSGFTPPYTDTRVVESRDGFPFGANFTASREALLKIGGFRTGYGRSGSNYGGGEETIAATLIQRLGYLVVVTPFASVHHHVDASRYSLAHIWKTTLSWGLSEYRQRIDLYISEKPDLPNLNHARWEQLRLAFSAARKPLYRRLEHLIYFWSVTGVTRQLRKDLQARQGTSFTQSF